MLPDSFGSCRLSSGALSVQVATMSSNVTPAAHPCLSRNSLINSRNLRDKCSNNSKLHVGGLLRRRNKWTNCKMRDVGIVMLSAMAIEELSSGTETQHLTQSYSVLLPVYLSLKNKGYTERFVSF